jgi:serine/threonine-protein kinase
MANTVIFTAVLVLVLCNGGINARRFKNAATNWCLDSDMKGGVYTKGCYSIGGGYQDWAWVSGGLKNLQTGNCLEANFDNVVYARECDGNSHQKWVVTDNLGIINSATGSCLDSNAKGNAYTHSCNKYLRRFVVMLR